VRWAEAIKGTDKRRGISMSSKLIVSILLTVVIVSGCNSVKSTKQPTFSPIKEQPTSSATIMQPTLSPTTEIQRIDGIYYFEITWEPHGWSFLRFYEDGTVINRNTNVGLTPEEGWKDIQNLITPAHRIENWHGTYLLEGNNLSIIEYAPGSEQSDNIVKSECTYTKEKIVFKKINDKEDNMEYLLLKV